MSSTFDLDANRGPWVIRTGASCCALAVVALVGRLLARRLTKAPYDASDYTLILGYLCADASVGGIFGEVHWGVGRHLKALADPDKHFMVISKLLFMGEIAYCLAITLIKISILLFYRSIFHTDKNFTIPLYVITSCCILWGIGCTLVSIFSCNPVHAFWDESVPATCISTRNFFLGNAIPNIVIDLAILSLPQYEVWKLQKMAMKTRVIIACMFALGGFVTICSGLRLYFLLGMDLEDLTWSYANEHAWACVELQVAVVCACLPTLRPLFRYVGSHSTPSSKAPWKADLIRLDAEDSQTLKPSQQQRSDSAKSLPVPAKALHGGIATARDDLEIEAAREYYE